MTVGRVADQDCAATGASPGLERLTPHEFVVDEVGRVCGFEKGHAFRVEVLDVLGGFFLVAGK